MHSNAITAQSYSLEVIFTNYSKLQIPFFQRSYVWKKREWSTFLETMKDASDSDNDLDCFMGAIVLKHEYSEERNAYVDTVIDGQQRLITTLLFFKSMCEKFNDDGFLKEYFYKSDVTDGRKSEKKIILEVSHLDEKIFDKIMNNKKITDENEKKSGVYECYNYFNEKKSEEINIYRLIKKINFVVIGLQDNQDEQKIFDTLNSVGVDLTTAELLKNHLFRGRKKKDIDDYKKYWVETFEKDQECQNFWDLPVTSGKEKRSNIEVFFQAFFYLCNEKSVEYTKLNSLYSKYKNFVATEKIKEDMKKREAFLENIKEYGKLYLENIDSKIISKYNDKDSSIQKINLIIFSLNIFTIVPYVLYILKTAKDKEEKMRDAMLSSLESYIMRRVILSHTTKNYNNMFASLHRNAPDLEKLNNWIGDKNGNNEPTNEFPNDVQVKKSFEEECISNKNARTVLYFIEEYMWVEEYVAPLKVIDDYSVEHIMPKGWHPSKWPLIENYDNLERNKKIGLLGNLTIIPPRLNSQLRNESWDIKKNGRKSKNSNKHIKGLKECCCGVRTFDTDDYLNSSKKWDELQILHRTRFLAEKAIKIWKEIPNPPK